MQAYSTPITNSFQLEIAVSSLVIAKYLHNKNIFCLAGYLPKTVTFIADKGLKCTMRNIIKARQTMSLTDSQMAF